MLMNQQLSKLKVMVVRHHEVETPGSKKQSADTFHKISAAISNRLGSPIAFFMAVLITLVWGLTGPIFHFSDTWQLIINTGTTIVTFLMVFVIQNTQNRDGRAMQLKLDELISATKSARTEFVDLEDLNDGELDALQLQFKEVHDKFHERANRNK